MRFKSASLSIRFRFLDKKTSLYNKFLLLPKMELSQRPQLPLCKNSTLLSRRNLCNRIRLNRKKHSVIKMTNVPRLKLVSRKLPTLLFLLTSTMIHLTLIVRLIFLLPLFSLVLGGIKTQRPNASITADSTIPNLRKKNLYFPSKAPSTNMILREERPVATRNPFCSLFQTMLRKTRLVKLTQLKLAAVLRL